MEEVSGKDLNSFFQQWIFEGFHPTLEWHWWYEEESKSLQVSLFQKKFSFKFPLEIGIYFEGNEQPTIQNFQINKLGEVLRIPLDKAPSKIVLDPNVRLLFEATMVKK